MDNEDIKEMEKLLNETMVLSEWNEETESEIWRALRYAVYELEDNMEKIRILQKMRKFAVISRTSNTWKFSIEEIVMEEKSAVKTCIELRNKYPENDYGYIEAW